MHGEASRRAVLGAAAGIFGGLAGCSAIGSGGESTPTLTPAPVATSTGTGASTETRPPAGSDTGITVANVERRHSFFYSINHGRRGVAARPQQYLFMNVFRETGSRPRPDELELAAAGETATGTTTPAGLEAYADRLVIDGWGPAHPADGPADWVAFALPAPLQAERAVVRWPAADRTLASLPATVLELLAEPPPDLSVRELSLSDRVAPDDPVLFSIRVRNDGNAGIFRGVLTWLATPKTSPLQTSVAEMVPADATATVEGSFDGVFRLSSDQATFKLSSNGGIVRESVPVGTATNA